MGKVFGGGPVRINLRSHQTAVIQFYIGEV